MTPYEKVNFATIIIVGFLVGFAFYYFKSLTIWNLWYSISFYAAGIFWGHRVTVSKNNERNQ